MSLLFKLVLALLALAVIVVIAGLMGNRLPWSEPPGVWQRLLTYITTNVAETRLDPVYPELRERRYTKTMATVRIATDQALTELGWEVSKRDEERGQVHAVITTALWQFKDDVRIQLRQEDSQIAVEVRSASRVGRGDLGANTRHILDFYAALERALGVTNS